MTTTKENSSMTTTTTTTGGGTHPFDHFRSVPGRHSTSDCASSETLGLPKGEAGG